MIRDKKTGKYAQEFDNMAFIKFYIDAHEKTEARDKALREGKKLGEKCRTLLRKWLNKKR